MTNPPSRPLLEWAERHPGKVVLASFLAGFGAAVWLLTYAYIPNQLNALQRELDECERAKAEAKPHNEGTPAPVIPSPSRPSVPSTEATVVPDRQSRTNSPEPAEELGLTAEELREQIDAQDGHFAEREALIAKWSGKKIRWKVRVSSVGGCSPNACLIFQPAGDKPTFPHEAEFPAALKDRVYALRTGDVIVMEGVLRPWPGMNHMKVYGTDFRVVR